MFTDKSISREKLSSLLRQIPQLSPEEREYVKAVFNRYGSGGVSKGEAEKAIRTMKFNTADAVDPYEAEKIKTKILSFFNN